MITAESTVSPSFDSASAFSFCRIIAEISGGEYCLPCDVHAHVAVRAGDDLVRDDRLLLLDLGLLAAHEPLDREDRVLGVHHRLALGHGADEALARVGERDDGRGRAPALGVLDDLRLAALEHGHRGVGRSEVDSDRLRHCSAPSSASSLDVKKSKSTA